jgi:sulfur carrier protein ThiS
MYTSAWPAGRRPFRPRSHNWGEMRVTILPAREVKDVEARTVGELLKALGLHRDAHLVVRGEDILTSDVRLTERDELEVWPVISGGHG